MTKPEQHRGRPLAETASEVIRDDDNSMVPALTDAQWRCSRCRHPLTAPALIRRGIGRVCVHLEISDALVVVA